MIKRQVKPDIRNFVNATAHPAGCFENVKTQVTHAEENCPGKGASNILVIGSSTGYGLASMITGVFGYGARGLGVCFEKGLKKRRSATAGYYNVAALHKLAKEKNRYIETLNGDAFSHDMRRQVVSRLKEKFGKLDYIIYSLASSRRTDPDSGELYRSCIKPLGKPYTTKSINVKSGAVETYNFPPALEEEIAGTVKVMGGEDWELWIDALREADLLAPGCRTLAYTYIGSRITAGVYRSGTIGAAKKHLEKTALKLNNGLQKSCGGGAWVCSCQGLVTKASSVIPAIPLYISLLKKVMGNRYESPIGQMVRLFTSHAAPGKTPQTDEERRIRIDDRELSEEVQEYVIAAWEKVSTANIAEYTDFDGFQGEFLQSAGFALENVNYEEEVDVDLEWGH